MGKLTHYSSDVYINAAESIDSGEHYWSCCAIAHLYSVGDRKEHRKLYEDYFGCYWDTFSCLYIRYYGRKPMPEELKEIRVLTLCLMATIVSSE